MQRVGCWILLVWCYRECRGEDELFPTVNLVSVLRRKLVTNNDDFTPRSASLDPVPAPSRRSQYLPSTDLLLGVIHKLTRPPPAPDGIQYPRPRTTQSYQPPPTILHTTAHSYRSQPPHSGQTAEASVASIWRRRNNPNNKTTTKEFKKSEYLRPNNPLLNGSIFSVLPVSQFLKTQENRTSPTMSVTTHAGEGKVFYETVTKNVDTKTVPQFRASKAPAQPNKVKKQGGIPPVFTQSTHYHGMVIDEYNMLQWYTPFTGQDLGDLKQLLSTKFFKFANKPKDRIGRLVPNLTKPTAPNSVELLPDRSDERPNEHVLDMAPAKGHKIEADRLKHRICDRNVLVPEGPKYDVRGHLYRTAFELKFGKSAFPMTYAPKYVIPRCCNCCKKSVLGCE